VAIHAAALACCATFHNGWIAWSLLLGRDLAQLAYSSWLFRRHRVVVIGPHWHMSYGLSVLAWGALFILQGSPSPAATAFVVGVSALTLADYIRRCQDLSAGALRRA